MQYVVVCRRRVQILQPGGGSVQFIMCGFHLLPVRSRQLRIRCVERRPGSLAEEVIDKSKLPTPTFGYLYMFSLGAKI